MTDAERLRLWLALALLATAIVATRAPGATATRAFGGGCGAGCTGTQCAMQPASVTVTPQRQLLVSQYQLHGVTRLAGPEAAQSVVLGTCAVGADTAGGVATTVSIKAPYDAVGDASGTTYVSDSSLSNLWRVDAAGNATLVLNTGTGSSPEGLALGPDKLYIALTSRNQVVAVPLPCAATCAPPVVVAGSGAWNATGDGGPATAATMRNPSDVALGPDGSLYIADNVSNLIRKVTPDGIMHTVAGGGSALGDGGPALGARLYAPRALAVAKNGDLYIADFSQNRIREVEAATGIIRTVLGTGSGQPGDRRIWSSVPTEQPISLPTGVALSDDGRTLWAASEVDGVIFAVEAGGVAPVTPTAAATSTATGTATATATPLTCPPGWRVAPSCPGACVPAG